MLVIASAWHIQLHVSTCFTEYGASSDDYDDIIAFYEIFDDGDSDGGIITPTPAVSNATSTKLSSGDNDEQPRLAVILGTSVKLNCLESLDAVSVFCSGLFGALFISIVSPFSAYSYRYRDQYDNCLCRSHRIDHRSHTTKVC